MRKVEKTVLLAALLLITLTLTGCRSRILSSQGGSAGRLTDGPEGLAAEHAAVDSPLSGSMADLSEPGEAAVEAEPDPQAPTRENPDSDRKEYDENAPAELVEGTDRAIHGEGEGTGASVETAEDVPPVSRLKEDAEKAAVQTVAADGAERMGVSDDAEAADSAMTYFTVLLQDRLGSLYECKRLNLFWETAEDHVTVSKASPEHDLILSSGAYDVSARLLEENLRVDDGWIGRKDPGVIVKITGSDVLGQGVASPSAAKAVYGELLARPGWTDIDAVRNGRVVLLSGELLRAPWLRTAAMLIIAKTAYPFLFGDTEIDEALRMLTEEATGAPGTGILYYPVPRGVAGPSR